VAEAAKEGGRGRGRHPESGPGGHAGMWIGGGARGGLDAPSKPICRGCLLHCRIRRLTRTLRGFEGSSPFLNNTGKTPLPCFQALEQVSEPVLLPVAPIEVLVIGDTLLEVNGLLPAIRYSRPRVTGNEIVKRRDELFVHQVDV
jgi:hypothetical protein